MAKPPSKAPDPNGGHVRLYWEILDSPAWNCLTASDQRVYNSLARQLRKTNNGDICLTLTTAKHFQIRSPTTLAKSLRALVAVGLLVVTRKGSSDRNGHRDPTLYAVTHLGVYQVPKKYIEARTATNDWKKIRNLAHGKALIKAAELKSKEEFARKKLQHQNLAATGSINELVEPNTSPKIVAWKKLPLQKLNEVQEPQCAANPIAARVSSDSLISAGAPSTHQKVDSFCIVATPTRIGRSRDITQSPGSASTSQGPRGKSRPRNPANKVG